MIPGNDNNGGQERRMAVMAMNDIRFLFQQNHQIQSCPLQQHIHGKIIEVAASGLLPGNLLLILLGIGIHATLGGETVRFNKIHSDLIDGRAPNRYRFPPFLGGVVHIDLEDLLIPAASYASAADT